MRLPVVSLEFPREFPPGFLPRNGLTGPRGILVCFPVGSRGGPRRPLSEQNKPTCHPLLTIANGLPAASIVASRRFPRATARYPTALLAVSHRLLREPVREPAGHRWPPRIPARGPAGSRTGFRVEPRVGSRVGSRTGWAAGSLYRKISVVSTLRIRVYYTTPPVILTFCLSTRVPETFWGCRAHWDTCLHPTTKYVYRGGKSQ